MGGNLIIKKAVGYNWNGCISRLWSEAGDKTRSTKFYDEYQHQGIKIFIDKTLNVSNQIRINLKSDIPLLEPSFTIEGVSFYLEDEGVVTGVCDEEDGEGLTHSSRQT